MPPNASEEWRRDRPFNPIVPIPAVTLVDGPCMGKPFPAAVSRNHESRMGDYTADKTGGAIAAGMKEKSLEFTWRPELQVGAGKERRRLRGHPSAGGGRANRAGSLTYRPALSE
jgi:hypothetical protein